MNGITHRLLRAAVFVALAALSSPLLRADQWTEPTKEELSMTAQPEVPGAAAVYLNREEITDDKLPLWSFFFRLKAPTEKGKDYANVELNYRSANSGGGYTVSNI